MKRKKIVKRVAAAVLTGAMVGSTVVSGLGPVNVIAADVESNNWEEIQSIVSRYYGEWNTPVYTGAITNGMPRTALLGNGDVGVTSNGNEFSKSFYLSKSDFWTYGTGVYGDPCPPILIGGVTIGEKQEPVAEGSKNIAPTYKSVSSSSHHDDFTADKAVNGKMQESSNGYGWVSKRPQDGEQNGSSEFWLKLEYENPITIGRYVVKSDGAVRPEGAPNNTKDFELQISDTGADDSWRSVDTVTDNAESIYDKNLEQPVEAKFVRLFITKPTQETTADNKQNPRARIGQLEFYAEAKDESETPVVESKNLALKKPIQVSGFINNPGTPYHSPGEMLVDGNASTKWCATPKENADGSAIYWAMIDLGEAKDISRWVVKHAQSAGEGANYNTKDFALQYTTSATPDPAKDEDWIDADVVEGNKDAVTDRNLEKPINTRYVRLHVTKPENQGNDAVRLYELELYTDPKDPNTVFYEKQDILNAEIQTRQEIAETATEMKTWLSSDKNVMVTELKSNGSEDAEMQVDTWASDNDTAKKPLRL